MPYALVQFLFFPLPEGAPHSGKGAKPASRPRKTHANLLIMKHLNNLIH